MAKKLKEANSNHTLFSSKTTSTDNKPLQKNKQRRKFQVSNGYLLEFDQLARVLFFMSENRDAKKITRIALQEDTGLANRQIESLVSIGAAMGLIQPGRQTLTPIGLIIASHDIFLENKATLEWCHYSGSGSYRNLVWYEIFNSLLSESGAMTQDEWMETLRRNLAEQYTERTIGKHLYEEVRFVADAYLEKNLSKYHSVLTEIENLIRIGILSEGVPMKLQSLSEKQKIIKNFDQCLEWYNAWAVKNNFGKEYTNDELSAIAIAEEKRLVAPLSHQLPYA